MGSPWFCPRCTWAISSGSESFDGASSPESAIIASRDSPSGSESSSSCTCSICDSIDDVARHISTTSSLTYLSFIGATGVTEMTRQVSTGNGSSSASSASATLSSDIKSASLIGRLTKLQSPTVPFGFASFQFFLLQSGVGEPNDHSQSLLHVNLVLPTLGVQDELVDLQDHYLSPDDLFAGQNQPHAVVGILAKAAAHHHAPPCRPLQLSWSLRHFHHLLVYGSPSGVSTESPVHHLA
ncbi:hypothetical protein M5K25_015953 [Dendrobium thyrsiflorum]|uniref:Uncharacterized protein n=1 Tax=Dendrobium thyrsiflorum TaxID=117978 RepID=A0ABD0URS7_DENTH